MPASVIDASVVGAWCFQEDRAPEALSLMLDSDLHAPHLMAFELASIARKKARLQPERAPEFRDGLATAMATSFVWVDVDHLAVLDLALARGVTTYDASYLYLSQQLAIPLLTFDRRLAQAAQSL